MADKRIDQGYLGESALRLGRFLQVGGLVSPQFDSQESIRPTISIGAADGIGFRGQQQRAWSYGELVPAIPGFLSKLVFKAPPNLGIIFDGFLVSAPDLAGGWRIGMLGASDGDPFAIGQTNCRYVERLDGSGDQTGILTVAHNADAAAYGYPVATGAFAVDVTTLVPIPMMLLPNAKLIVSHTVANAVIMCTAWGRVLPL